MRLVDSSAWIEYLKGTKFGVALARQFPAREDWLVPTILQLEIAKWLERQFGGDTSDQFIAFTGTCIVADLTTPIALSAAACCAQHHLATADAIIYATAKTYAAELLTCDKHFKGLHGVNFVPKPE